MQMHHVSYLPLIFFTLSYDVCSVTTGLSTKKRLIQGHGNANTCSSDENKRNQIDDEEQEEEEGPPEVAVRSVQQHVDLVEAVVADLSGDVAEWAVDRERVAVAVEIGRGENEGQDPGCCDHFAGTSLAMDEHRTERVNYCVVPVQTQTHTNRNNVLSMWFRARQASKSNVAIQNVNDSWCHDRWFEQSFSQ